MSPAMAHLTTHSNRSTPRLTVNEILTTLNSKVPYINYTIDHFNFKDSCLELLHLVFPKWFGSPTNDMQANNIKLIQCTEGITNKLMKCKNVTTGQVVLIRAYGKKSELLIDRQSELLTFIALKDDGLAPPLFCRFENGFVYGYAQGTPIKPRQMSDPKIFPLIARKIAQWHFVDAIPGQKNPKLFKTLWKWFQNVTGTFSRPEAQTRFDQSLNLDHLRSELERLELAVKSINCPIVFCHNDLLSGNIILCPGEADVAFIDYEYGAFNYRSFDVANHFCEYAGFDCNYDKYPNREYQRQWIRIYLLEWSRLSGTNQSDEAHVESMLTEVALFTLAAHFFWGLWGLTQAQHSDIEFDYMNYACLRFAQYEAQKHVIDEI